MHLSRTQNPSATSGKAAAHRAMALAALHADSSLSVRLKRYNAHMVKARALETMGGCAMSPVELVGLYIDRVTRIHDVTTLKSLRWRGLGAIHALHASGLLTDAENADALNLFVDTCSTRRGELAAAPNDSEGGAQ